MFGGLTAPRLDGYLSPVTSFLPVAAVEASD